jgi:hypothetical protein
MNSFGLQITSNGCIMTTSFSQNMYMIEDKSLAQGIKAVYALDCRIFYRAQYFQMLLANGRCKTSYFRKVLS